jgi:hypothetical protein
VSEGRRQSGLRIVAAGVFSALLVAIGGATSGGSTHTASAATERAASAPRPWRSYPLNQVGSNLADQARQDACDFARRQREPQKKALLIFLMGRANKQGGDFGVGRDNDFIPNSRIVDVLAEAGDQYKQCRENDNMKVDIAYGVTNYELRQSIGSNEAANEAGKAQARAVKDLRQKLPRGVGAVAAGDIEPGWDERGSGRALELIRGAAGEVGYYNFGTAGQCPPFGPECQGNWTISDVAKGSQDQGVVPLPQIYYPKQAALWADVANRWDRIEGNCSGNNCYVFGGATSQPKGCTGVDFRPADSFNRLKKATNNVVQRRLIYFNPRRVGCRSAAPRESAAPQDAVSLPLMSEHVPGEVIKDPDPVVSEYVMGSLENAWRAGTASELTWVYAGTAGPDPVTGLPSSDGRLVIVRELYFRDRLPVTTTEEIDVEGSGALRIAEAPLGRRAIESDQIDGVLDFAGDTGVVGSLDLSSGVVRLASER